MISIEDIAKENNVVLHLLPRVGTFGIEVPNLNPIFLEKNEIINRSFTSICNKIIIIGFYKNQDWLLASFFHELGHILDDLNKCKDRFDQEVRAWVLGFQL